MRFTECTSSILVNINVNLCVYRWAVFKRILDEIDTVVRELNEGKEMKFQSSTTSAVAAIARPLSGFKYSLYVFFQKIYSQYGQSITDQLYQQLRQKEQWIVYKIWPML